MEIDKSLIRIIIFILILYFLFKLFKTIFKKPFLSKHLKYKSEQKYHKLHYRFVKARYREPDKNEKFRMVIQASHIAHRHRGSKGHWVRQKIRKHLLEKHKIVHKYIMR